MVEIRNEENILIAEMKDEVFNAMFTAADVSKNTVQVEKTFKKSGRVYVNIFHTDMILNLTQAMKIYIFSGYYIRFL